MTDWQRMAQESQDRKAQWNDHHNLFVAIQAVQAEIKALRDDIRRLMAGVA